MDPGFRAASSGPPAAQWFDEHEVIVASHRGPIEHHLSEDGALMAKRGSGGLTCAFEALARSVRFRWVAAAMTEADEIAARREASATTGPAGVEIRYALVPRPTHHAHYSVFSNRFLWFLQHGLQEQLGLTPQELCHSWTGGYRPANLTFASLVAQSARTASPVVLVQDYQLYLVPRAVRARVPDAAILHFCHIPWPEPRAWEIAPAEIRREILSGLLGADILGFQDSGSADRFLRTCRIYAEDAVVDLLNRVVQHGGRQTAIRVYPISVHPPMLRADLLSPVVQEYRARLARRCGEITIVRVDRLDPSKNIPAGFRAFGRLLERRPDLVGRVRFLAFLVPSRTEIAEYRQEYENVLSAISAVNHRFGRPGYQPVEMFYENNRLQALAGMSLADVVLVNPLADGMNLVAKEAPIVSQNDAALVLSTQCGAWSELHGAALGIDPRSDEDTAAALEAALSMSRGERSGRLAELRRRVEAHDLLDWLDGQCEDLSTLRPQVAPEVELLTIA